MKKELIPYNDKLIKILQTDHKNLLSAYAEIMAHAENKNYPMLETSLETFLAMLRDHLHRERVDLYMYIEIVLSEKLEKCDKKAFRGLRLELSRIAIVASSALNQYINNPVTDLTRSRFIKNFSSLGEVLVNRIEREEKNIFPVYANPPTCDKYKEEHV